MDKIAIHGLDANLMLHEVYLEFDDQAETLVLLCALCVLCGDLLSPLFLC